VATPWPLRGSDSFLLESKAVGDTFAVGVVPPERTIIDRGNVHDDGSYRLVYVLDGAWALALAAGIAMLQLVDLVRPGFQPLLLVGVDYPEGHANCRSRDYTMDDSVWEAMRPTLESSPDTTPGGAPKFLAFLEEELDPVIRSRYPVKDEPAGILGDSFGGTFTFYAFLRQTRLFDRYWLGSPGIFTTSTDYVARFAETLQQELVQPTRMYLTFGEAEANGPIDFYADMGRNYHRTLEALATFPNEQLTYADQLYPGHTHTTVVAPALNDALIYLYGS
jgi:predicted alpha/beta superfamily hydrolase